MLSLPVWSVSRLAGGRGPRIGRIRRLGFEPLETRCLLTTVHFQIDPQQDVRPISRFIYGVNESLAGNYANLTATRLGGNRWTAYNWENNASNAGSDYFFQNDGYLGGGDVPGGAVRPMIENASDHNAAVVVTVPINGYVAADKHGGGDVRNSGPNYLQTRFRQERPRKGAPFTLTPDVNDGFVYQDEFVNWVNQNFPYGQTDPVRRIFFELDNEPDLWASTHAAIHPDPTTYAELVQKTVDYAAAIKDVAPDSLIFGPVNYGWHGFTTLQDAPDRNGRDFHTFYLQQLAQADSAAGRRLIDVMDIHWYPEAQGGGVRITENNNSAAVVAARVQAPRSLWDSTYTETSWITQWSTMGPIRLLPRVQSKIDQYHPDTRLAITEYNYGGGSHISGAIAQADVLGIFGREGVFAANEWPLAANESFIEGAFRMYRDYDGNRSTFGDLSVRAVTDDIVSSSIYASRDTSQPDTLTLIAINKTDQPVTAHIELQAVAPTATASIFRLTSASSNPQYQGQVVVGDPDNFSYEMPAYSVSTFKIRGLQLTPQGDFNRDGSLDCQDVDALVEVIASETHAADFDLTGDSLVDHADLTQWLALAGSANLASGNAYLPGDANLDGIVEGSDFNLWNAHKFTQQAAWCSGDFSADGHIDGTDFNLWNANKFTAADRPALPSIPFGGLDPFETPLRTKTLIRRARSAGAAVRVPWGSSEASETRRSLL